MAPEWWATVDWGTAPAWASSVLSGGSLLLAVSILARDRIEKRRASADKLSAWSTLQPAREDDADGPGYEYVLHVNIFNSNDAPLPYVVLEGYADGVNRTQEWFNDTRYGAPEPIQERSGYRISTGFWTAPRLDRLYVVFSDLNGRERVRNLKTGKYLSARRSRSRRGVLRRLSWP